MLSNNNRSFSPLARSPGVVLCLEWKGSELEGSKKIEKVEEMILYQEARKAKPGGGTLWAGGAGVGF